MEAEAVCMHLTEDLPQSLSHKKLSAPGDKQYGNNETECGMNPQKKQSKLEIQICSLETNHHKPLLKETNQKFERVHICRGLLISAFLHFMFTDLWHFFFLLANSLTIGSIDLTSELQT